MSADPRDDRLVLAIDLGTGGPKVGFVSVTGRVAWQGHDPVTTNWLPDGGAEQAADLWWQVICAAIQRGLASGQVDASRVVAVSVTGQWASTVPVDEAGQPVGPCIMWMDTRGGRHVGSLVGGPVAGYSPRPAVTWIRRTGAAPSPAGGDPIGHMLFLQRDHPDVARRARWFLEPVDYLSMRFTGIPAASHASMTAAWLTDNRQLGTLAYDDDLVRLSTVDASKLPPLVATGSVVGMVTDEVARQFGLPLEQVQVVTGTPDLHSGAFGSGAVGDFEPHMTISTTSWISAPVPFKKTNVVSGIASIPGLTPGRYLIVNNQDTAGRALQWLRDTMQVGDYDELLAEAAEAPAGAGGVIFTPWLTGERSPISDRKARAGFHNISIGTGRAELIRAVAEGVAYNSRWLHAATERFAKRRLDNIRLFGGGAVSDIWCQILADVMDRTIDRVEEPLHAGIRGAALLAGVALGDIKTEEVRSLVTVDRRFEPTPAHRAVYDRLYEEFPRLYKVQKGMFARLNGRTPAASADS